MVVNPPIRGPTVNPIPIDVMYNPWAMFLESESDISVISKNPFPKVNPRANPRIILIG